MTYHQPYTTKGTLEHYLEDPETGREYRLEIYFVEVDDPGKYTGPWEDSWPAEHSLDWSIEDTGGAPAKLIATLTDDDVQQLVNARKEELAEP